jgi:hypothetical protein
MNNSIRIVIVIFVLIVTSSSLLLGQTSIKKQTDFFRDSTIVGKDTIRVFINKIPFRKNAHHIDSSKTEFGVAHRGRDTSYIIGRIDGNKIFGTDGEIPRYEIGRFEVSWNGRPVIIPKSLYSDCFEANFKHGDDAPAMIEIVTSEDSSRVLIEMHGSDAGGSYTVWWIISKNGKHSRFIARQC